MGVEPLNENLLDADSQDASLSWGSSRRAIVMASAIAGCFFLSGLVFGFSAIHPEFIAAGVFADDCVGAEAAEDKCAAQYRALGSMFTLATSMLNVVALPSGALIDACGPRFTASLSALLVGIGCVVFSTGGPGVDQFGYNAGFTLMGVAGPVFFIASLSFPNLYPGLEGRFTAALVGCFDASSAVFIVLAKLMHSGISLKATFLGYAIIPFCLAVEAIGLWPQAPISEMKEEQGGDGIDSPLASLPFSKQIQSAEYWLLMWTVAVSMVVLNFFIATAYIQLDQVDHLASGPLAYAFSLCLPAGGIVYIPVVGKLVDQKGPTTGFAVLWTALFLFNILNGAYAWSLYAPFAYLSFVVFAFCRPLFYTLYAAFVGQVFGFSNFGTLYGLLTTAAGVANFSVAPLSAHSFENGFLATNTLLAVLQLSTVGLPLVVTARNRRRRAEQLALTHTSPRSPTAMEFRRRSMSGSMSPVMLN